MATTTIFDLQRATLEARKRTGDSTIGARIAAGRVDVVRVTYDPQGKATVIVLSGPHLPDAALLALSALQ